MPDLVLLNILATLLALLHFLSFGPFAFGCQCYCQAACGDDVLAPYKMLFSCFTSQGILGSLKAGLTIEICYVHSYNILLKFIGKKFEW